MTVTEQLKNAMIVATPIVAITTPDQPATARAVATALADKLPILQWDVRNGLVGVNETGVAVAAKLRGGGPPDLPLAPEPPGMLRLLEKVTSRVLVIAMNAQYWFSTPQMSWESAQALLNIRDVFSKRRSMAVLLAPHLTFPAELGQDVMVIDEPLPDGDRIRVIVTECVAAARSADKTVPEPTPADLSQAVEALSGLSEFTCEQAAMLSLLTKRLNVEQLWERKRQSIRATPGLGMDNESLTFGDIGGMEQIKGFGAGLFEGPEPPHAIVRVDELEKMMGSTGSVGDSSGVAQDQLGTILREMEDNEWLGIIAVGVPGSGKSLFSKTLGATHRRPTFSLDLGAMKGSLVGQSEQQIRQALKVIKAVAGKGAYFVATCNSLDDVKPELRRRFTDGIWYFDLPNEAEREDIWRINTSRYKLAGAQVKTRPHDDDWTGAEIRNCCRLAYRRGCSLTEAAAFIVPVSVSNPEMITRLRAKAHGAFLSASAPGVYRQDRALETGGRRTMEAVN